MRTSDANTGDTSRTHALVVLLSLLAAAAIFALDLQMPLGVAVGVLYVPVIALSSMILSARSVLMLAVLATVLIVLAWVLSPPGGIAWMGAANRVMSILALWSIVVSDIQWHRDHARADRGKRVSGAGGG